MFCSAGFVSIKKAECWRTDAFEWWCWTRLLRITARRSNQSILKEISSEYSLERLMLKLKRQYFGHLMRRTNSLGNILMLGKIEGMRRRGRQRMRDNWMASSTQWTWVWVNSGDWWWIEKPGTLSPLCHKELDTTEQLNWSEIVIYYIQPVIPSFIFLSCYILILLINILFMDTWVILGTVTWTLGDYSLS